MFLNKAYRLAD